jgi:NAD(P)-dependent dehydrogenase (short-subunit alcohol dehydrogenase family)
MPRLEGKSAIITGGNGGIGSETALLFAKEGADVLITDILIGGDNEKKLEEIREKAASTGHKLVTVRCDVSREDEIKHLFHVADQEFGKVDILVNNAGLSRNYHIEDHPTEVWHKLMSVNLDSAFYCCREAAARMLDRNSGGVIISMGSIAGMTGRDVSAAYAASKAGIVGLTRCLAAQLAPSGIRVNAICPGPLPTAIFRDFPKDIQEELMSTIKLNRWGSTMDIANLILFLSTEEGSWITGEAININGGAFMG